MSERLDAEHRYKNHARNCAQYGRTDAAQGDSHDAECTNRDEPLPRRVVCEEASHGEF